MLQTSIIIDIKFGSLSKPFHGFKTFLFVDATEEKDLSNDASLERSCLVEIFIISPLHI